MAGLDRLPAEILCAICIDLEFGALSRCRLVSRQWRALFTPFILSHFESQNIDLSAESVQRLSYLASSPADIRGAIRTLNLVCLHNHTVTLRHFSPVTNAGKIDHQQEALWIKRKQDERAALPWADLGKSLTAALDQLSNLDKLSLEGVAIHFRGAMGNNPTGFTRHSPENTPGLVWKEFWDDAVRAFRVVLLAAARSQTRLKILSMFQNTARCGIPSSELTQDLLDQIRDEGFARMGTGLRKLSISIGTAAMPPQLPDLHLLSPALFQDSRLRALLNPASEELTPAPPNENTLAGPELHARVHENGLVQLLDFMPNLEFLDLHLYVTTSGSCVSEERPLPSLLSNIFHCLTLSRLENIRLRGLRTDEQTLKAFLCHHPQLQSLALVNMFLSGDGSWTEVLATAVKHCRGLCRVELCNLWQPNDHGPLHLESNCPMARRFNRDDADIQTCWTPSARRPYVWFRRTFTARDIWELADIPSGPTRGSLDLIVATGFNQSFEKRFVRTVGY
jgi:hypothetical protein